MRDMATASLSGNLTRGVELRSTPSGAQVAALRVGFTTRRPDGNGGWADKANYVDVEVWGGHAASCAEFLCKGSRVLVSGELDYQEWPDRNSGQKRSALRVRAQTVVFAGGPARGDSRPADGSTPLASDESAAFGATSEPSTIGRERASADELPF